LPLKLHEAAVTFVVGIALLVAVVIRHPIPVGRLLKAPDVPRATDEMLGVVIGAFLVLHALLQLVMALLMPTAVYLTAGRVISWAVIAVGALGLWTYLRRLRRFATGPSATTS
jgi:hypothetical protein